LQAEEGAVERLRCIISGDSCNYINHSWLRIVKGCGLPVNPQRSMGFGAKTCQELR